MKAISLWQPYASLWACTPRKKHETRDWKTERRGWLLVHAAKIQVCHALERTLGDDTDALADIRGILIDEWGGHWAQDLPHGALVGAVYLSEVLRTVEVLPPIDFDDVEDRLLGNFAPGRYAWLKSEFKPFDRPIPYKGRQNFFEVPDDIVSGLVPEGKRA